MKSVPGSSSYFFSLANAYDTWVIHDYLPSMQKYCVTNPPNYFRLLVSLINSAKKLSRLINSLRFYRYLNL